MLRLIHLALAFACASFLIGAYKSAGTTQCNASSFMDRATCDVTIGAHAISDTTIAAMNYIAQVFKS